MSDWLAQLERQVGPPGLGHYWNVLIALQSGWVMMSVRAPTYNAALMEVATRFLLDSGFDVLEGFTVGTGALIMVSYDREVTPTVVEEWHRVHGG